MINGMFSFFGNKLRDSTDNLDFLDQQLTLSTGGNKVLSKLRQNPTCTVLNVYHNSLADTGIQVIIEGLKKYKVGTQLEVLSLSGCQLTNVSLISISEHFLTSSNDQSTSLTHLQLSANRIGDTFNWNPATISLGQGISSSLSSLRFLSLTSNPKIGKTGIQPLLDNLRLGNSSRLAHLQLSVCELNPDSAEPLALWLRDPEGAGRTLKALDLNGNHLSGAGVRRIARSIISGECSALIHLSFFSNEVGIESEWKSIVQKLESEESEEEVKNWSHRLSQALQRNENALNETSQAGLSLLSLVRTLLNGNPRQLRSDTELIRDQVESLSISEPSTAAISVSTISNTPYSSPPSFSPSPFPFLRLPIELQIHILHCTLLLPGSSIAPLFPPILKHPFNLIPLIPNYDPYLSSPTFNYKESILTQRQLVKVLEYGMDRKTLRTVVTGKNQEGKEKSDALWEMGCAGFERS